MKNCKRILDSVHGYIYIDNQWIKWFVDNPYFQRLRRIEQTSGRSIYPSARHDRFIHSLGVYHLGSRIIESIKSKPSDFDYKKEIHDKFFTSYKIACLMHDCGHTPFSHTFETYFKRGEDELPTLLIKELDDKESYRTDQLDSKGRYRKVAPHEYLSAILCLKKFRDKIVLAGGIPDLVARMIVGIQYTDGHSFENCLISLIHGDVIDADRLDYVCRDRWASGYSTSTVDIERLISSIHIVKTKENSYKVCFDPSVLHDIEGVLAVKEFQQLYVINHHTVRYEQYILQRAMENTAYRIIHNGEQPLNETEAIDALKEFCNPSLMWDGLHKYNLSIQYPMDDDFIVLMKNNLQDPYVYQWFARSYDKHLLWKNKAEFFSMFPEKKNELFDKENSVYRLCDPLILSNKIEGLDEDNLLRVDAEEKNCEISSELNILMSDGTIKAYDFLFPKKNKSSSSQLFFYLYLSESALAQKDKIKEFLANNDIKN